MTELDKARATLSDYVALPQGYPVVGKIADSDMNLLIRRALAQKDRRFSPEPILITNFGDLK